MNATCPPYRDWMGRFMAEYITVGKMDGFWFDGTPGAGDVGPYGREAYLRDTGKPVPEKLDWDSQEFKEWFVWRYDKWVEFFNEFKKRRPYMDGETLKYSALLVSQQMRDFHDATKMWNAVAGLEHIHRTEHLLTDVIFDDSLMPERLAPYPVVVLANSTCLSDAQCDALRSYVRGGGTLLATMESSLYDKWGNQRENFGLADLFGADYVENQEETAQILVPRTQTSLPRGSCVDTIVGWRPDSATSS